MNKKGFIKVSSSVLMDGHPEYIVKRNEDATFEPSQGFLDKMYYQNEKFREPVITFIKDVVPYDWGVIFTPYTDEIFDVNIYCNTVEEYR